jgi:hypothetical protein
MVDGATDTTRVAETLQELAEHYARRLGPAAIVDHVYGQGIRVRLRPTHPDAVEVGWSDVGGELGIAVSEHGWRRVARRPLDVELIRVLCDAAVAGHGYQVTAPGRVAVTLTPTDGPAIRLIARTGWVGLVPLPAWTRLGRRTPYAAYD